tara:strand:+ start:225 stop:491 length:267 start_codon:yes stop_codon:yes gene_type:complete
MKKAILIITLLMLIILAASCAESKTFVIDGKNVKVKPYGWMNKDAVKNDSVVYRVSTGNVIWSALGAQTLIVPIWLTGNSLFEPVRKK